MSYDTQRPHIASYLIFRRDNKIAFLLRSFTDWMNNMYGLPAGKVEAQESFVSGAIREAYEEVGIKLVPEQLKPVLTMHRFEQGDHAPEWVDMFFEVDAWEGELMNAEPDKHARLDWLDPKNLPENVIPSLAAVIEAIEAGEGYLEYGWEDR